MTKEGFTKMVTFKRDVGERVNYVTISRENTSNKATIANIQSQEKIDPHNHGPILVLL